MYSYLCIFRPFPSPSLPLPHPPLHSDPLTFIPSFLPLSPQAVQNRLYDDYAALYYLLLSKWEMGQLHVAPIAPSLARPRLSNSGIPPVIPQISIEATDLGSTSDTSPRVKNPFRNVPPGETQEESDEFLRDPTLARYLRHGRRHTLGAAQHYALISPDELSQLQLRQISECSSSQTSNALGSESSNSQFLVQPTTALQQALGFTLAAESTASQTSVGSTSAANRYLQIPAKHSRMEKRRASDGGPYAHAYKLFLDMRNSQLTQIDSSRELEGQSGSHTSSVKQLFEDQKAQTMQYGKLPPMSTTRKDWLQFKNQVSVVHVEFKVQCLCIVVPTVRIISPPPSSA